MNKYETIIVIDSLLKGEEIESIVSKFQRFISDNGGEIEIVDQWGKKRLAYEIKKRQYGYYVLIRFDAPGNIVKQLEREYRLNESILRYKVLKLEVQALKALARINASREKAAEAAEKPIQALEPEKTEPAVQESADAEPTVEADEEETPAETAENNPETEKESKEA
ncbi:30S ribosomal protein S6 [candidate division KSB1 bacterium]|nr:30S ribosomal protein S6 [candidate division KSB1 bacterium]